MKLHTLLATFSLATASLASVAGSDHTSDHILKTFDWSGAYAGVHLGHGWADADFKDAEYNGGGSFPIVKWDVYDKGLLGGFQGGYNWQSKDIVYGLEGEIGYLDFDKKKFPPGIDPVLLSPYDAAGKIEGGWYAGLSGRLGYAHGRTLVYGKVGAVYSNASLGFVDTCTTGTCGNGTIDSEERAGWGYQLGAGMEHAFSDRWSLKAEYAYFDFGKNTVSGRGIGGVSNGIRYDVDADLKVHMLKVGLNYRF